MKIYAINGQLLNDDILNNLATYMDDEKREQVHAELAPCSPDEFLERYLEVDQDFEDVLQTEFIFSELETGDVYDDPEGQWQVIGRTETMIEVMEYNPEIKESNKSYLVSPEEAFYYINGIET